MTKPDDLAKSKTQRRVYTVNEALEILQISRAHFYRLMRKGLIRTLKIGNCRRVSGDALDAVLERGA